MLRSLLMTRWATYNRFGGANGPSRSECGRGIIHAIANLVVEDATFLVDLDYGRARVVMDDSISPIMVMDALLLEGVVARILYKKTVLVPYRNMRVNEGVFSRH